MKRHILWFLLAVLASCNTVSSRKELSEKGAEEKLVSDVDKYFSQEAGKTVRPVIAVTAEELSRLKKAWETTGAEHDVLAGRFARADEAISAGLVFPPEGGQHNQWYQCDSCQRSLVTIDPHQHQCLMCKRIYSGFPYDNVLYNRQHSQNIRSAEDAAWAWTVTGEKKYADHAAAVLLGYAERYLNYPMIHHTVNDKSVDVSAGKKDKYRTAGHMQPQTLDESMSMVPAAVAYDLIYSTLSPEQRDLIEKKFIRPMAENIEGYKAGKSNWQTWHNAAFLYAGAVTGDAELMKQALLDPENGFAAQMKISVMPEGMWYENSWGYHYYTLSAMTHIAEGARRLGIDLYSFPQLKKMYLLAFDYLMADGSLPRFGDAVQDSPRQGVNEKAFAAYRDERLLSAIPAEPTWDAIILGLNKQKNQDSSQLTSKLIPGAGHAILATNGPGKLTAALSFGPYGGFHGHYDKLSFVLFGYGEELGVDPGRSASQAYRLPIHSHWYKASTGHNVVLVDGNSQQEAGGSYLAYKAGDSFAAVTADAGPAFKDISHWRFMLLSPDYLLVIDELKPSDGKEHTYDWLYHNRGTAVNCNLPAAELLLGTEPEGYAYLKDIKGYKSEKDQIISTSFTGEKTNLIMTMAGEEGDEVFTATGPFKSVEDRVPMVIVRRKGKNVRYAALFQPVQSSDHPLERNLSISSGESSFSVSISNERGKDLISFPDNKLENFIVEQKSGSGKEIVLKN